MPSKSTKQAKTMSAIAHGWHPTGEAAGIPVKVAKEFHAADAGKKYGHKKGKGAVDRSAHHPGNPGFNRTEKILSPPLHRDDSKGVTHVKQQKQKKDGGYVRSAHMKANVGPENTHGGGEKQNPHTGYHTTSEHKGHGSAHHLPMEHNVPYRKGIEAGDSFEQEIKEHFPGKGVAGIHKTAMPQKNPVTPHEGVSHEHGHPSGKAEHHERLGEAYHFPHPMMSNASGFGHGDHQKHGTLRLSGHKGAHRLGSRNYK